MSVDEPLVLQNSLDNDKILNDGKILDNGKILSKKLIVPLFLLSMLVFIVVGTLPTNNNDSNNSLPSNENKSIDVKLIKDPNDFMPDEVYKVLNGTDIISNMTNSMNQFALLFGPRYHSVDELRKIKTANEKFSDLFGFVATYISESMSTDYKDNPSKVDVFDLFEKLIERNRDLLRTYYWKLVRQLPTTFNANQYGKYIGDPLDDVQFTVKYLISPYRRNSKNESIAACERKTDAIGTMRFFMENTYIYNYNTEQENAKLYADFHHIFDLIERHPNFKQGTDIFNQNPYENYEADKLRLFNGLSRDLIGKFYRSYTWDKLKNGMLPMIGSTWEKVRAKIYEVDSDIDKYVVCTSFPYCTSGSREFEREIIYHLLSLFRMDVLKMEFAASLCNYVRYSNETRYIQYEQDDLKKDVNNIFNKMISWADQKINMAWPEITKLYAKRVVDHDKELPENLYNQTAEKVRQSISKVGTKNYDYQVLILPNRGQQDKHWIVFDSNKTAVVEDYGGVTIIINRYEKNMNLEKVTEVKNWLNESKSEIDKILNEQYSDANLTQIFESLSNNQSLEESPHKIFNSMAIVYNSRLFGKCKISFGVSSVNITNDTTANNDLKLYEKLNYFYNPFLGASKCFNLFFII